MTQQQKIYYDILSLDNWSIYIATTDKGLCFVGSMNGEIQELKDWVHKKRPNSLLIKQDLTHTSYAAQLTDYLKKERKTFDLPNDVTGTPFQLLVWQELQKIPYGKIISYSDIANNINMPNAARAVGTAIGANPLLIVVPCHRVLAKNGKLTGFRGGLLMKEKLLELEEFI